MAHPETFFHPLANDERGLGFQLGKEAKRWRVQQMTRTRGRQDVLFDLDHRPLDVAISATATDLADAMRAAHYEPSGRYRLVPVDAQGVQVEDQCAFIVFRSADDEDDAEPRNASLVLPPSGPTNAAFDIAAVTKAITEGMQKTLERTLEPTITTLRLAFDKLIAANVATTDGLMRSRVPQAFEVLEEEPSPLDGQQPFDVNQIGELLGKLAVLYQGMKQGQPAAEPRNAAPPIEENGIGLGASMRGGGAAQP